MDIAEEEAVAAAGTAAQGDLAEVVARASAMAMAAATPSRHHRRPPSPSPSPSPAAADHSHHIIVSSAPATAAGQQIMVVPAAYYYNEEPRPAAAACRDAAVAFDALASMVVDPYPSSSSGATAPPYGHGGCCWLPPQQISQHTCYGGLDVAMGGAAADTDGEEPMMMRISPVVTPPPASHHQIMNNSRKNEVKKVVCIPALPPATASSRPGGGGEVIPSDLWAWRKYGQKPIKGSPYPRGYYRCSSSKGCMARKQVERSRSDPNMLVITYTAEHNHPWPMQRNVLAGYSRPHSHMSNNCKKKNDISCTAGVEVEPAATSSKNVNNSEHNAVPSSNIECLQMTNMTEAGYVAYAINDDGVALHQPINCNGVQPSSDEVFAELEELEPSNPENANIYSRGESHDWQKF